jgi:hypothetical protein
MRRRHVRAIHDRKMVSRQTAKQSELVRLLVRSRNSTNTTCITPHNGFQVAKIRLAEHVTKHEPLNKVDPEGVPLEAILIRYWEEHGNAIPSAEQARFALAKWSDHFSGATVADLTPQVQETFIAALRANGYQPSYISRILSVGRAALMRAWKCGELTSVPFIADVERDPEQEAERFRDLSMDEVARLLRAQRQLLIC